MSAAHLLLQKLLNPDGSGIIQNTDPASNAHDSSLSREVAAFCLLAPAWATVLPVVVTVVVTEAGLFAFRPTGFGATVQSDAVGAPAQTNCTLEENPPTLVTTSLNDAVFPAATVADAGDEPVDIVNPGLPSTVLAVHCETGIH